MMRRVAVALTGSLLVTALTVSQLSVRLAIVQGNDAFRQGIAVAAQARYEDAFRRLPDSGTARFNLGTVAYSRGQYLQAAEYFEQSATELATLSEQAEAHYNRGNALFQLGNLPESREAFKGALRLDPSDEDARYNFVFVDQLIRSLEHSGDGRTNQKPLTRDQAEQLLSSLGQKALRISRISRPDASPTSPRTDVIDK